MSIQDYEEKVGFTILALLESCAKSVSGLCLEANDEPMDCDDTEYYAEIFKAFLDFQQGNITKEELEERTR